MRCLSALLFAVGAVLILFAISHYGSRQGRANPIAVRTSGVTFVDASASAGLTFRYDNGRKGMATILEEAGSGCAMLDYNGDGWPDLYLLNGRDLYGRGIRQQNALYRNNGDGTFTDVTREAGVPGSGYGLGVAANDYDNDGLPDLYLCQWGKNCLYHNNGNGTFSDVTDRAGVGALEFGGHFHTGAAWIDYDRDGRLDLFVCSYVRYRPDGLRYCRLANGLLSNCPPSAYDGTASILYHNNGDGTFTNVTRQAGVYFPGGKALSAITCDFDRDGWLDLYVGNDGEEAWLLRNNHNGTFRNVAPEMGVAFAEDSATMAAMGIDFGDYLNDGREDLYVADFSKRPNHLWEAEAGGYFKEVSTPSGIGAATFSYLGFGAGFLDYDNDGWLDLFTANGHVYPEVEQGHTDEHYLQQNQLFHNERNGRFRETTREAGPGFQELHAGRGAAFGDYDCNGTVDILVNNNDGPPLLLQNQGSPGRNFVSFKLIGGRSGRDAIGARIRITVGGLKQFREVRSGGSYLSSSDPRLHFGLGAASVVDHVEVIWPSGVRQRLDSLPADRFYQIREGDPHVSEQTFRPLRRSTR